MRFAGVGDNGLPWLATDAGYIETDIRITIHVDAGLARRIDQVQLIVLPHHVVGSGIEAAPAFGERRLKPDFVVVHDVRVVAGREKRHATASVDAALTHAAGVKPVNHLAVVEPPA